MFRRNLAAPLTAFLTTGLLLARAFAASGGETKGPDAKGAEDPVTTIQQLNRTAMQYFDDLNYAMAEKTLLEALALVEKSNLAKAPAALSTNGNLAVLYSAGLGKPDKAVFHFKKALAIKPDLRLSRQRTTAETEANLARAKAELAGSGGGASAAAGPRTIAPAAEGGDFRCPTGGEVAAGEEITLKCLTTANVPATTVMLYYKSGGAEEFEVARMTKEDAVGGTTTWVARVPAARAQGDSVHFYFEAYDASGNSLALSGAEDSPSVVSVKGGGGEAALGVGPPPEEEGEEEEEEEDGEEFDDSNPLAALERERYREREGSKGIWWIGLGAGSGFGYASGDATEAFGKFGVRFSSGVAWAATGQLVPEIGYFIGRNTALALTGRNQGIFGGPKGTATGAHSVLLRALFFTEDSGKLRWFFATALGWGEGFRLRVSASVQDPETGDPMGTVKDTVRGGPFLAGLGGGMQYKVSRRWFWTMELQALVGFTDVSAVVDLTTGARWQF